MYDDSLYDSVEYIEDIVAASSDDDSSFEIIKIRKCLVIDSDGEENSVSRMKSHNLIETGDFDGFVYLEETNLSDASSDDGESVEAASNKNYKDSIEISKCETGNVTDEELSEEEAFSGTDEDDMVTEETSYSVDVELDSLEEYDSDSDEEDQASTETDDNIKIEDSNEYNNMATEENSHPVGQAFEAALDEDLIVTDAADNVVYKSEGNEDKDGCYSQINLDAENIVPNASADDEVCDSSEGSSDDSSDEDYTGSDSEEGEDYTGSDSDKEEEDTAVTVSQNEANAEEVQEISVTQNIDQTALVNHPAVITENIANESEDTKTTNISPRKIDPIEEKIVPNTSVDDEVCDSSDGSSDDSSDEDYTSSDSDGEEEEDTADTVSKSEANAEVQEISVTPQNIAPTALVDHTAVITENVANKSEETKTKNVVSPLKIDPIEEKIVTNANNC